MRQALDVLLAGQGLSYRLSGSGTVIIELAPESSALEDVIVVGSREGGRSNFTSLTPVGAVSGQDIVRSPGFPGEVGAALAANNSAFEFPRYSNDGAADTVRAGQLLGLKPDQTLVLINGKRAHTTAVLAVEGGNGQ